ncbi:MAG: prepilin-type N-terminal cleavage/methylation domain-containing protein [Planctomycetota bacterium]
MARAELRATGGFTLVEMLVALSILTVGITTLLLSLGDSMALRRSTDARIVAAEAVEGFVQRIATTAIRRRDGALNDLDLELVLPERTEVPESPGMFLSASMATDDQRPGVWLLRVRASWMERGDLVSEEFLRVLPRQLPLRDRVRRFRDERAQETAR